MRMAYGFFTPFPCRNGVALRFAAAAQSTSHQHQAPRPSAQPPRQHGRRTRPCLQRNPPEHHYQTSARCVSRDAETATAEAPCPLGRVRRKGQIGPGTGTSGLLGRPERWRSGYSSPAIQSRVLVNGVQYLGVGPASFGIAADVTQPLGQVLHALSTGFGKL